MRRFGLALTAMLVLGLSHSVAQQVDSKRSDTFDDSNFAPADVFEIEFAASPQVSPDGSQIVYLRRGFDIMTDTGTSALWTIDSAGNHLPLITGKNVSSPIWSPDGTRIAFVASEKGKSQIHCYWVEQDRATSLTRLTESASGLTWSPDGKQIAFFMRVPSSKPPFAKLTKKPKGASWAEPPKMITNLRYRADGAGYLKDGFRHLFVISSDGGTPRQLTSGDFDHGGNICWTPDSQSIILSANRRPDADYQPRNSELYHVDIQTRAIKPLTDRNGPDSSPALSSDGRYLAFVGFDDQLLGHQNNKLYVIEKSDDGYNGTPRAIVDSLDRSVSSPTWSQKHNGFLFTYLDQGDAKLALATLQGQVTKLADNLGASGIGRPYASAGSFSVANNGTVALSVTGPEQPGDLARLTFGGDGALEQLTQLNRDLLGYKKLGQVQELRFASSHDQQEIQSWVITPPDFDPNKKYPLILEIHGGPFAAYGDVFTAELQLMAASGYVVLYANPRGSTSYGQKFANLIHHNYPGEDYDDLMSAVDAVVEKGFVDENQMYVTGGSGGGVLTAWIIGNTDRFKAAVVAKPVINWYSFALTADGYNYFYKYWFPGFPWDHQDQYMKRSPISLVGNVKTPTMLLTGESDYRTPISESEQYYQALKLRKVDAALVRIPGASHGIAARPSHLLAKVAYILKWFETHP